MAGHTAHLAVLIALDILLEKKTKGRKSVDWYKSELTKIDKKLLFLFNNADETLQLVLGYDGNKNAKIAQEGLNEAETIIYSVKSKL
ncbi:MAG: DUF5618 family protein [Cytophagales bacterium]|nr:DUF5618 family protein [Cytophagales bacterium]